VPGTATPWPISYVRQPDVHTPVTAEVRLHGRRVGQISYARGGSEFRYEDDLSDPAHRTLGQIFEDDPRAIRRARVGVSAWFANLLPEGALRRQIVREMGGGNVGNFTLLVRLGGYLPGAVTVHADAEPADDSAHADSSDLALDHPLRHSLAGVQLKYSVSSDRLAFPVTGKGGWWIVKLPDRALRNLTTNEYLTMRWLSAAGFAVPPVHLVAADSVKGLPEVGVVAETVERLRAAWADELRAEATTGFEALATHFSRRLDSLPICTVA
jgi:serine/threonine-protein kinase HipA